MISIIVPSQFNAYVVLIEANSSRYPVRFFSGFGKDYSVQTAWSLAGAVVCSLEEANYVAECCAKKRRKCDIVSVSFGVIG